MPLTAAGGSALQKLIESDYLTPHAQEFLPVPSVKTKAPREAGQSSQQSTGDQASRESFGISSPVMHGID